MSKETNDVIKSGNVYVFPNAIPEGQGDVMPSASPSPSPPDTDTPSETTDTSLPT